MGKMSLKEVLEATANSIDHWKKMINWAKTQIPDQRVTGWKMFKEIKETWSSDDCPLCQAFFHLDVTDYDLCKHCPLRVIFGSCNKKQEMNAWQDVSNAKTWGEWLEAAEVMLQQLQATLSIIKIKGGKWNKN